LNKANEKTSYDLKEEGSKNDKMVQDLWFQLEDGR